MIDFEAIARRVCLDSELRREFLLDPVKITEQLLNESHPALPSAPPGVRSRPFAVSYTVQPEPTQDVLVYALQ